MVKILFLGDIVGRPGREIVAERLPRLRAELGADFVIANGENAAAGAGLTAALARPLLGTGVDALTLGDHLWDQKGFETEIADLERVCRPANLPAACPGRDHLILEKNGFRLAVFTVLGRQYLALKSECPFQTSDRMLQQLEGRADAVFVEVHAEATSEKQGLGWYLDGRVAAVVGTHTHVPTADACVLPKGTAFQCDAGMTGPYASVLGRLIDPIVARFRDGMPRRAPVAEGDVRISGVVIEYDPAAKRATRCEPVMVRKSAS
ncbi:MAG TPA: TIGR00282 family metallophosphoesterase [Opitutaceae bacterium]|nr:TIGR00282 family metallophosphoesterase [Opitutaceae bacterium]